IGQMGAYYNHVLVELRNMVDTIKEKEQHIQFLADRDPMTELYNRRKFNELLNADLLNDTHAISFYWILITLKRLTILLVIITGITYCVM
ncbi:MAG: hypothetical protein PWP56_2694, partial [Acetobacterium sp.]|nr:hypothetical protein [Acetobacterium sp.]